MYLILNNLSYVLSTLHIDSRRSTNFKMRLGEYVQIG